MLLYPFSWQNLNRLWNGTSAGDVPTTWTCPVVTAHAQTWQYPRDWAGTTELLVAPSLSWKQGMSPPTGVPFTSPITTLTWETSRNPACGISLTAPRVSLWHCGWKSTLRRTAATATITFWVLRPSTSITSRGICRHPPWRWRYSTTSSGKWRPQISPTTVGSISLLRSHLRTDCPSTSTDYCRAPTALRKHCLIPWPVIVSASSSEPMSTIENPLRNGSLRLWPILEYSFVALRTRGCFFSTPVGCTEHFQNVLRRQEILQPKFRVHAPCLK